MTVYVIVKCTELDDDYAEITNIYREPIGYTTTKNKAITITEILNSKNEKRTIYYYAKINEL